MNNDHVQEVKALARLARLALSPQEIERYAAELPKILHYVEKLAALDVTGVAEYMSAECAGSGLRADDPAPDFDVESILAGVPDRHANYVRVPKIKGE
jgi:aspartyl-tRNA(Asn)/glutamyl-tRNA(Gln) amidotransferase subunit C